VEIFGSCVLLGFQKLLKLGKVPRMGRRIEGLSHILFHPAGFVRLENS
jgi:hypothetical protein